MTCVEYENAVIALFQSGKATEEQWREMAAVILGASENGMIFHIDESIYPDDYPEE